MHDFLDEPDFFFLVEVCVYQVSKKYLRQGESTTDLKNKGTPVLWSQVYKWERYLCFNPVWVNVCGCIYFIRSFLFSERVKESKPVN